MLACELVHAREPRFDVLELLRIEIEPVEIVLERAHGFVELDSRALGEPAGLLESPVDLRGVGERAHGLAQQARGVRAVLAAETRERELHVVRQAPAMREDL